MTRTKLYLGAAVAAAIAVTIATLPWRVPRPDEPVPAVPADARSRTTVTDLLGRKVELGLPVRRMMLGPVHTISGVAKACHDGPIKARDAARAEARARNATPSGPSWQAFPKGWLSQGPSAALPALARLQPCCARAPCIQPLAQPTRSPEIV
ncbi:hypothetical protein [Variovorax sp. LT1R16]|uniref:hypothetical protein n=1 Tax=Variovorax sp. LT1R16 TaxID=3443728 RepID=UPI003F48C019